MVCVLMDSKNKPCKQDRTLKIQKKEVWEVQMTWNTKSVKKSAARCDKIDSLDGKEYCEIRKEELGKDGMLFS